MTVRALFIAALLLFSQSGFTQIETVIRAVEIAPSNIILPADNSGMMTFRPCDDDCDEDYIRVRLSAGTKFSVNGENVKFADFRRELVTIKRAARSYALVTYETETNTVTSIQIAN
jgi:hypothetical protein